MPSSANKIHIVLLTDCLADLGGAEKQILELAKRLDKTKYTVTVASLDCYGQTPEALIQAIGCQLKTFRVVRIYGLSGLLQGMRFLKFLRDNKVDILQTYHFSSDIWGTFWGRLAGVKVILSNRRDMGFWRKPWHVWAYRLLNRWVTKIIVVADAVKQMVMQTEGVPAEKIAVIYNGIEINSAISAQPSAVSFKKQLGIAEQDKVLVHVANLKPVKGHIYLLQAIAQVVKEIPHIKVMLIGKDELPGQLQDAARELGIQDKVLFLGQRKDVAELLSIADVCVLPSLSEGMSNAILEYMSAGKAVVATRVGGNPELVVHKYNGLLVEKESAGELRNALLQLLKHPDECQRMGMYGLKVIKECFSLEVMVRKYEEIFQECISKNKS